MNELQLSIILPTYNERENITILLPLIEAVFKNVKHEIIVVDDNSPDYTAEHVLELNKKYGNIKLIRRARKHGIGAALREGYNCAQGKIIISSDADLSFSVQDMPKLIDYIEQGYDLAIGCRHNIAGGYYEMKKTSTFIKGIISRCGNVILMILAGMAIHDFSANFRAIRRESWRQLNIKENANVMLFEMIIKAKYEGMNIVEVPVSFSDRVYGKSKLNFFVEIPKFFVKMLFYIIRYRRF